MSLAYAPLAELRRIRELDADPRERAALFADACRLNSLYMIARAGSGHVGTSLSSLDLVSWLHLEVLAGDDVYFSSKGHDAPALYSVLAGTERIPFELIHSLRRLGGLAGHPDVRTLPEVTTNTGSLGMGVSKAKGFVRAARLAGERRRAYVLTGDGELQEGQFWESLPGAVNEGMGEITAIVDHNKLQSDTWIARVSDLGDLEAKVRSFGWEVRRCDGNDLGAIDDSLAALDSAPPETPRLLIADTVKGAGVSFMEPRDLPDEPTSLYDFHSGAPSEEQYEAALSELCKRIDERLGALGADPLELEAGERSRPQARSGHTQRMVGAYAEALAELGAAEQTVTVLDADLVLDCGLIPFRERFPERFVECGIAEQDMVSQAGALALAGRLPIVHSFACFLSTRPNEQIYNNASEGTKVIYVGSLAGLVPGGPGHSHQSVRDISALGAMPGMALVEPCWESQVGPLLRWAAGAAKGSVYVRLVSVPWELPFEPPAEETVEPGRGTVLRQGADACLVAAGPVMVAQAHLTAESLAGRGIGCGVIALPWLRDVDGRWLAEAAGDGLIACLDNHYAAGGQGDALLDALDGRAVLKLAVDRVPECGTNEEVLAAHRLDVDSIAERVAAALDR